MNTLSYEIDGQKTDLTFPSTIAECSGPQLTAVAAARLGLLSDEELLVRLYGIPIEVVDAMSPIQRFKIVEATEPVIHFEGNELLWKKWKIPTVEIGGETFHGPEDSFGNITWGEFIYADQCMIQGFYQAAIAAMFRPERPGWDGETDRRMPFTVPGTTHRFPKFGDMDGALATAIVWNYRAVRSAAVDAAYPALFPYFDPNAKPEKDEDEDEDEPETKDEPTDFSWINVHRNILGEHIQDEDKFLNLPMHTVLYRLNTVANESRKSKQKT
ncbi:MAG: hypothetical protein IJK22_05210 [Bacteroidales bacterium]|nr:hypothetical protein [Bacteroidales bacterium]